MTRITDKFRALIQWFVLLEIQEHKHWCQNRECPRRHSMVCWYCTGLLCANTERKDCPACTGRPSPRFREGSDHDSWLRWYREKYPDGKEAAK